MKTPSNMPPVEAVQMIVLSAASPRVSLPIDGDFVHCLSSSEDFLLFVNRSTAGIPFATNRKVKMPRGDDGQRARFTVLELRRKAVPLVVSNEVILIVGSSGQDADYSDGSLSLTAAIPIAVSPTTFSAASDLSVATATSTQLLASNTARREAIISNVSSTTFRIGGATVGAAQGISLSPGASLFLTTTGEIRGYQASGVAALISAAEIL